MRRTLFSWKPWLVEKLDWERKTKGMWMTKDQTGSHESSLLNRINRNYARATSRTRHERIYGQVIARPYGSHLFNHSERLFKAPAMSGGSRISRGSR
jgi:hypothetical protein